MEQIVFVPGAVLAGNNITLPGNAPGILDVVGAEITRLPGAISAHAAGAANVAHVTTDLTALTDHDDNPTYHDDHAAADIAAAIADHEGADPVVAAVPTKVDSTHITLDIDTGLGDLLTLWYNTTGGRGPEP